MKSLHALSASLLLLAAACGSDADAGFHPSERGSGAGGADDRSGGTFAGRPHGSGGTSSGSQPLPPGEVPGRTEPPVANRCASTATGGDVLYVATTGSDSSGNGSSAKPFATLTKAVSVAKDESSVVVRAGTYHGRQRLDRSFAKGIVVRSETPHGAKLRNDDLVVSVFTGQGITLEGFDIAHEGEGAAPVVIQIQDLRGEPGGSDYVSRITLRNNVIHDSFNNDLIKLNNGAGKVTIEGNIFYNQSGSDEHIDVNSVTDVVIQDNVFFNDFAGSGRPCNNDTSSFIVVKDSNDDDDSNLGSERITIRRNVFANWEGNRGQGFVLIGEDGKPYYEAKDVLVENNLLLGNSTNQMQSPFAVKGARDITFRHNTVVGNTPTRASILRATREGENQVVDNVRFYNNVWSSPAGAMERFSDTDPAGVSHIALLNNAYWNSGKAIPGSDEDAVALTLDRKAIIGDPRLPLQSAMKLPRLDARGKLADGSASQCEAFARLVAYGTPGSGSILLDKADATQSPGHDILGAPRASGKPSDLGAVER